VVLSISGDPPSAFEDRGDRPSDPDSRDSVCSSEVGEASGGASGGAEVGMSQGNGRGGITDSVVDVGGDAGIGAGVGVAGKVTPEEPGD
jgi:hypothetical protein